MEIFKLFGSILVKTDEAEKSISKTDSKAQKFAGTLGKGVTTAAKWGAGLVTAAAGAATAVVGALLQMDEATKEYRENQAKLTAAWEASGKTAAGAKEAYRGFYEIIGDQDTATEAAQLLSSLVEEEQDIVDWTDIAAGVYAKFGDALPINSLIEAANETAKTGQITGALADALNWAGIQEDDFQKKLDSLGTEQERNALITETLYSTYDEASSAFYRTNEEVWRARDAQMALDEAMAKLGGAVESVKTRLLGEFGPAIADIVNSFVDFTMGVEGADEALQQSIQNMVDKIVQELPQFLEFGIEIIVAIAKGIVRNLPYLLEQLPGLIAQIVDALMELADELFDVGKELLDQLWDGAKSVWNDLKKWFEDKVSWITDKLFFWRSAQEEMRGDGFDGSHASGLPYVPYDGYRAILHKGETVVNAANSQGMVEDIVNGLAGVLGGGRGSSQPVVVKVYLDKREMAEAIFDPLNDVSRRRGEPLGAN